MAVECIVKLAGLLKAEDVAVVFRSNGLTALAVNKAIIVTDGDVSEWVPEDATHIVSNVDGADVDEVIDMTNSGISEDDPWTFAVQSAAQMALIVSEPGPLGAKFLTKLVADDVLAARHVNRGLKNPPKDNPISQKWYKAVDGGWTSDPKQAVKKVS